jgi:glyoxylase-like metal-dependent hydrolase (beta-lactamase superfamily II)
MMFYFPEYKILMTGDTIFHDGIGRTDLPFGDAAALRDSIANLMKLNLPDDTYVVHGHGTDSMMSWLKTNHPDFKS